MQRPVLDSANPEIIRYIEYLENKIGTSNKTDQELSPERLAETYPPEPETTTSLITISEQGIAKRTYRHLYTRQHRGGMGVFDLDISGPDSPFVLGIAEENQTMLVLTNRARAFRVAVQQFEVTEVHARGSNPFERLGFEKGEIVKTILPIQARGYVALLGASGRVRLLRHHLFGEHMKPGTILFNPVEFGFLTAACWTPGDAELFIVTQTGMGIRFSEKAISPQGDSGIRTSPDDSAIGITSVSSESDVFIMGSDGRGTIRQMDGFAANKSAGGSGKIAFKNTKVVGTTAVSRQDHLFIITRNGKIIRFQADEIPVTDGPVQGVNCISLRGDEVITFTRFVCE